MGITQRRKGAENGLGTKYCAVTVLPETELTKELSVSLADLEKRVASLEQEVRELKESLVPPSKRESALRTFGMFANDPVIDEIARLGREYRKQPDPGEWLSTVGIFAGNPDFPEVVRLGKEWRDQENHKGRKSNMAGYSGTPLVKKLGIKEASTVLLMNPPEDFLETLGPLPADAEIVSSRSRERLDVVLLFVLSQKELQKEFAKCAARLKPAGGLWVCWPKKASRVQTDVTENLIREIGLAAGLVDNKVCAMDETWSGLRFVIRLGDRKK